MVTLESIERRIDFILKSFEFGESSLLDFFTAIDLIEDCTAESEDELIDFVRDTIDEARGFDIEIIYYRKALDYLKENDCSLSDSIDLAIEYGYQIEDLNSELLASLHASREVRQEYNDQESDLIEVWELIEEYRDMQEREEGELC